MYMHTNKKIIICKFHLKNKCQSGEKCKFRHVSVNEVNDIFTKFKDLKQENTSLKRDLKDKCIKLRNLEIKYCDVTNDSVHALAKPLYNSFFNSEIMLKNQNDGLNQLKKSKEMVDSEESGIDDEFESIDKSSVKFKSKLKTQTDVNPKIEDISKNDQNNQNSAKTEKQLQNKQAKLEKRLIYLETQRQIEAKMNEKMFNELTSTTKDLNCTTKMNNSEIIEHQGAIIKYSTSQN